MEKANQDIRRVLHRAGVTFWQLGVVWGCSEVTVIRRLRHELPDDTKREVLGFVEQIKQARDSEL